MNYFWLTKNNFKEKIYFCTYTCQFLMSTKKMSVKILTSPYILYVVTLYNVLS